MSDLFKPIKFDLLEEEKEKLSPEPKKVEDPFPDIGLFKEVLERMRVEIQALQDGTSLIRRGAIQFPKGNVTPLTKIQIFETTPSFRALSILFQNVQQDLGGNVHDVFLGWVKKIHPTLKIRKVLQ